MWKKDSYKREKKFQNKTKMRSTKYVVKKSYLNAGKTLSLSKEIPANFAVNSVDR